MALYVSDSGNGEDYELIPQGMHLAVCYGVWDLGKQVSEKYGAKNQVLVSWETPDQRGDFDGEDLPMAISTFYTKSLHEKSNLRKDLITWRSRDFTEEELAKFDLKNILGKACQLQVIHKPSGEKIRARVAAVMPPPEGFAGTLSENPHYWFSFSENKPIPEGTPDWIQHIIKKAGEYPKFIKRISGRDSIDPDEAPF